jgi:acyltransferase
MERIKWVDTIKALGMFLVFYGHYIEKFAINGDITASNQFKIIYSFHMPLFFIISGFFAKKISYRSEHIRKIFLSRIIPVFSFAVISFPFWLIFNKITYGDFLIIGTIYKGLYYIGGFPEYNIVTWFLICLFTAELILTLLGLLNNNLKVINLFTGLIFIISGYFITKHNLFVSGFTRVNLNFWYIHESLIAIGFYLTGNWIYPLIIKLESNKKWVMLLITLIISILFVMSQILIKNTDVVFMIISQHGDFFPFIIHSLLGALMVICIATLITPNKVMDYIGSNTIILLGLNGIFLQFVNSYIAKLTLFDNSWWFLTLNGILTTSISLLICYPIVLIINKYLPQLFGNPFKNGPLLKSLDKYSFSEFIK